MSGEGQTPHSPLPWSVVAYFGRLDMVAIVDANRRAFIGDVTPECGALIVSAVNGRDALTAEVDIITRNALDMEQSRDFNRQRAERAEAQRDDFRKLLCGYLGNHSANADAEGMSALCECQLCLDTRAALSTPAQSGKKPPLNGVALDCEQDSHAFTRTRPAQSGEGPEAPK